MLRGSAEIPKNMLIFWKGALEYNLAARTEMHLFRGAVDARVPYT
jgi:hypothetical protein